MHCVLYEEVYLTNSIQNSLYDLFLYVALCKFFSTQAIMNSIERARSPQFANNIPLVAFKRTYKDLLDMRFF